MTTTVYRGWRIRTACSRAGDTIDAAVKLEADGVTPVSPKRCFRFVGLGRYSDKRRSEKAAIDWARNWIDAHS